MSISDDGRLDVTVRRWATTSLAMVGIGLGLLLLAPARGTVDAALADPQRLVDTAGPDALLVLLAWALAAGCWLWGSVGLVLTVASTRTGVAGRVAGLLLTVVLPAGARRAAALAVGLSLTAVPMAVGVAAPQSPSTVAAGAVVLSTAGSDVTVQSTPPGPSSVVGAPDWTTGKPARLAADGYRSPAPDWPGGDADDARVVLRGDCLWDIAADWLTDRVPGGPPGDAAVADAVQAWWQANAEVIGPDPDLLLPGQVLRPPPVP